MTFDLLAMWMFRILYNPLNRLRPVPFQARFSQAKRVLILCPGKDLLGAQLSQVRSLMNFFPKKSVHILYPGNKKELTKACQDLPFTFFTPPGGIRAILRSPLLRELAAHNWDILLDLTPETTPLSLYLCRKLMPPVRIGFTKPHSSGLFNLVYKGKTGTSYPQQLRGLVRFLKKFTR
jgi:hypothetical protein